LIGLFGWDRIIINTPLWGVYKINHFIYMKKPTIKKQILNRTSYIKGHLDGVKRMIKDDKYCIDIILQNEAIIAALKRLNKIILENHLNTCVTKAIKGKSEKERKNKIKELLKIFEKF